REPEGAVFHRAPPGARRDRQDAQLARHFSARQAGGRRAARASIDQSILVATGFVVVRVFIVLIIVVPVVIIVVVFVLVVVLFLFFVLIIVGIGPALGLRGHLEIHFVPRLDVDLLDIPVEVFDFDQLRVLVHRQHAERLFFFQVFVPLTRR